MKLMYLGIVTILGTGVLPAAAFAQTATTTTTAASSEGIWNAENNYWQNNYTTRPYYKQGTDYAALQPAYRYGVDAYTSHNGAQFEKVESKLRSQWEATHPGQSWSQSRDAVRDSYTRLYDTRRAIQTGQTGRVPMNNNDNISPNSVNTTAATNIGVGTPIGSVGATANSNTGLSVANPISPPPASADASTTIRTTTGMTGTVSPPGSATSLTGTVAPAR
jgi:hypothetical protein